MKSTMKSTMNVNPILLVVLYIPVVIMCISQVYELNFIHGNETITQKEESPSQHFSQFPNLEQYSSYYKEQQSNESTPCEHIPVNDMSSRIGDMKCNEMQKYILLSEQRSGSTWTCDMIDKQEGASCGIQTSNNQVYEMMIDYSYKLKDEKNNVTWSEWTSAMDTAFEMLCEIAPAPSIGFKLMSDQIPEQYKFDGHFEKYLSDKKIAVIQLVREATVLRSASVFDAVHEMELASTNRSVAHVKTEEELNELPKVIEKMSWNSGRLDMAVRREEENKKWQRALHFMPNVRHYYLSYEHLLTKDGLENHLSLILSFLMPFLTYGVKINLGTSYLRMHSPLCSSRIEDFDGFAKELEKAGAVNTVAACKMLETLTFTQKE